MIVINGLVWRDVNLGLIFFDFYVYIYYIIIFVRYVYWFLVVCISWVFD